MDWPHFINFCDEIMEDYHQCKFNLILKKKQVKNVIYQLNGIFFCE